MNLDPVLTFPHVFQDGRAGKWWILDGRDIDGPFEDRADALRAAERAQPSAPPAQIDFGLDV